MIDGITAPIVREITFFSGNIYLAGSLMLPGTGPPSSLYGLDDLSTRLPRTCSPSERPA